MIVELTFPSGVTRVNYGQARMIPDDSHKLQIPAYVAKTLLILPGVSGPSLTGTAADLLDEADEEFEANYLFVAYGKPLPDADRLSAAADLLTYNGEPTVSAV